MWYILLVLNAIVFSHISAQGYSKINKPFISHSPSVSIKTNILYDLTTSFNLGVEVRTASKYTLDISTNYNPWTFSGNKKFKHFMVQPEFRYWICEPFNGHFWGIHALYSRYNAGGIKLPFIHEQKIESTRYQGNLFGAGISYGYQWLLAPRWNLELTIGAGYAYLDYKAFECRTCGSELYKKDRHYIGPTKLGVSLMYIIR